MTRARRGARLRRRWRWLLLLIISLTTCTLVVNIALLIGILSSDVMGVFGGDMQVAINQAGSIRQVRTRAETVGELFSDIGLEPPPDAWLSHAKDSALADGMQIDIMPLRDVRIVAPGREERIRTPLENPLEILESAAIAVSAEDKIRVNGALAHYGALQEWTVPAREIVIRRPIELIVSLDGELSRLKTTAETVGEALAEAGIALETGDRLEPAADADVADDLQVVITRGIPVSLRVDGVLVEAGTHAERVEGVLDQLEVALFDQDYVLPPLDSEISAGMLIEVVRVNEEVFSRSETIPFEKRYQADPELDLDQTRVTQLGHEGIREIRSRLRYENGAEVSRTVIETVITEPPQDQVIHYGTRIVWRSVDTPEGPRQYWRVLCMLATSYHPGALGGDDKTSIGWTLAKGVVASDPDIIPYETTLFVPGYGIGKMADTAGWRSSPYWIDLGYSDDDFQSWLRYVRVYLLSIPAPEKIDYLLPAWTPIRSRPATNCVQ